MPCSQKLNRSDRFIDQGIRVTELPKSGLIYQRGDVLATRWRKDNSDEYEIWYGEVTKAIIRPFPNPKDDPYSGPVYGADWVWVNNSKSFLKMVWYEMVADRRGYLLRVPWHKKMPDGSGEEGDHLQVFRRLDANPFGVNSACDVRVTEHVLRKVQMSEWKVGESPRESTWVLNRTHELAAIAMEKAKVDTSARMKKQN